MPKKAPPLVCGKMKSKISVKHRSTTQKMIPRLKGNNEGEWGDL